MSEKVGNYGDKGDDSLIADGVPETRKDCMEIKRPCPHFNCRFHLWRDVNFEGKIIFNFERAEKRKQRNVIWLEESIEKKEARYKEHKSEKLRRSIKKSRRFLKRYLAEIPESCALDVAEDGVNSIKKISAILGIGAGDLERIENMALKKLLKSRK